ncbi:hypothetical protein, partial [Bradyrhizobium sp. CW4]|uniref:hypothetical protein n=1 Tax=Bradyrhizobium sp. CW4 TaxID=2782687 RepID=UPI001FF9D05E
QNRRCLNGSDAALDTKAIRQKRGRHRAEKIALTLQRSAPFTTYHISLGFSGLATPRWPQCLDLWEGET